MGLFDCFCIFCAPFVVMKFVCNDGLPTLVEAHVFDSLLAWLVLQVKCLAEDCCAIMIHRLTLFWPAFMLGEHLS